tara:strand:- start:11219 stop:11800 length:582 start_codon:yes stop_codon:yes gene_type:complete
VFKLYVALKAHFKGTFDVEKYHWNMKVSVNAYRKRKDRYFFDKLSDKYNIRELTMIFAFNFLSNDNAWAGDLVDSDAISFFRKREGEVNNAYNMFKDDLENMIYFCRKREINFKKMFDWDDNHPIIFKMLQQDAISYETFVIIDTIGKFTHKWDNTDVIWNEYRKRIEAYKKILSINTNTCRELFKYTLKTAI